ncbi:hypothetical protein IFM89_005440, partial [Coptis chinensis]
SVLESARVAYEQVKSVKERKAIEASIRGEEDTDEVIDLDGDVLVEVFGKDKKGRTRLLALKSHLHKLNMLRLELKGNIRVFCRVRPMLLDDGASAEASVICYPTSTESLGRGIDLLQNEQKHQITFDKVFTHESSQRRCFCRNLTNLFRVPLDGYKFERGFLSSPPSCTKQSTEQQVHGILNFIEHFSSAFNLLCRRKTSVWGAIVPSYLMRPVSWGYGVTVKQWPLYLPGKATILENMHGWELRPTFAGPRLPRWMEKVSFYGVSSFNEFIHELSVDSNTSSIDYVSDEEYYDESMSSTPQSQDSSVSRASSFSKYDRRQSRWFKYIFSWIMWPITLLLRIPFRLLHSSGITLFTTITDVYGVVEDLQLAIEIFIEAIFDVVHKVAHFTLSPSEAFRALFRLFSSHDSQNKDIPNDSIDTSVPTTTLGDNDPTPTERQTTFHPSLNTDARTCQDVITELGYPYEAISVVTSNGYVLLLERIPRRDARKVVYLQHGIMDSSMGPSALGHNKSYLHHGFLAKSLTVVDTLANIGLLLFLFLVGIELDPKSLCQTGKKALAIAVAGISVPFALGIGDSFALRKIISNGVDQASFLVFIGVALYITTFPVLARIPARRALFTGYHIGVSSHILHSHHLMKVLTKAMNSLNPCSTPIPKDLDSDFQTWCCKR